MQSGKIINDPVFGFINIPKGIIMEVVTHPIVQRLHRIKQLGLSSMVYPGAQHTRFQHSLGAFFLMTEAIQSLRGKGVEISDHEAESVKLAILLHDVGHGPFSHVLESTIAPGVHHEEISLLIMRKMNHEMNGRLELAIRIYKDEYEKRFLHQLVSSQLDMDRLDYLRRDSFYTGVTEGNIGSARIIKMLNVKDDHLVVESKGIYSIENFLTARRLMYWQVYLHKTSVACEKMINNTLLRAKELAQQGTELYVSPALRYFLYNNITRETFFSDEHCLDTFIQLDDNDIWCALKAWATHEDKVLATLSRGLVNRRLFKVEMSTTPFTRQHKTEITQRICDTLKISKKEATYLFCSSTQEKDMYSAADDHIEILYNDGSTRDIAEASDMFNLSLLQKKVKKYIICHHRL
ncbi:MAG: HD domain-containing protein [Bacteroidaceae bacterium]|nr:HD domain-containing protein [Bacteroidaceae bacterium]MBO7267228.1 HD domain-containing protein [Bacteroidaceae bacterium]